MSDKLRDGVLLLALGALLFLTNLGGPQLWDRDEPRNAGCAAEMLDRGDWVTPVFNAQLRPHKPVLLYWAMMAAYSLLGVNEWGARLPSALCGMGTVWLVYAMGRKLFSREAGLWGALAMATTVMFGVASRAATPDALLIFLTTLATAIYVWSCDFSAESTVSSNVSKDLFPSVGKSLLMFAVLGLAVLTKGPVGVVLPMAVIGMFLLLITLPASSVGEHQWWRGGWNVFRSFAPLHFLNTCRNMRLELAIPMVLLVALPWYVWVHIRTDGAWTYGFFVEHNVGRAVRAMEGHRGGILFYPLALLVGFFPWSVFWLPAWHSALEMARQERRLQRGLLFAACWVGVYVALFSIARTKLPSYITPCYPGVALLLGAFLERLSAGQVQLSRLWTGLTLGTLVLVGALITIAVPVASQQFLPGEEFLGMVGLILLLGGLAAWLRAARSRHRSSVRWVGATAVMFSLGLFAWAPLHVTPHRHLGDLVNACSAPTDSVQLMSYRRLEPSWVFYAGQPIEEHGDPELVRDRWAHSVAQGQAVRLITTEEEWRHLSAEFAAVPHQVTTVPYFLRRDKIVVIQSVAPETFSVAQSR